MQDQEINWLLRDKYKGRLTPKAKKDIERLKKGEHIDYLIGHSIFLNCKIDLSKHPLIPRPETEYWTEKAVQEMLLTKSSLKVLDIFCGSGCVGMATLKNVPNSKVDFADIETAYFPGIRKSARWNKTSSSRFRTIGSDIFSNLKGLKYDFILANPPYIPKTGRRVGKSVLSQEPHTALFGGKDGLRYILKFLRSAKDHLSPEGKIYLEFDPPQKKEIGALARRFSYRFHFSKDQYGRYRYCILEV